MLTIQLDLDQHHPNLNNPSPPNEADATVLWQPISYCRSEDYQFHAHTKHIDIHYHFICKTVARNVVEIRYCPTNQMITNIFTKALPVKTFEGLQELLGIHLDWEGVLISTNASTYTQVTSMTKWGLKCWEHTVAAYMRKHLAITNVNMFAFHFIHS